jgi:hypothetical protein
VVLKQRPATVIPDEDNETELETEETKNEKKTIDTSSYSHEENPPLVVEEHAQSILKFLQKRKPELVSSKF